MNCKPGDLVVIVRSGRNPENLGRFGTVLRRVQPGEAFAPGRQFDGGSSPSALFWLIEGANELKTSKKSGKTVWSRLKVYRDSALRPIRDQPGEDEMLRIAGLPQELPADLIKREATA